MGEALGILEERERWLPSMLIRDDVEFTCMRARENLSLEMSHLPTAALDRDRELDYRKFIIW